MSGLTSFAPAKHIFFNAFGILATGSLYLKTASIGRRLERMVFMPSCTLPQDTSTASTPYSLRSLHTSIAYPMRMPLLRLSVAESLTHIGKSPTFDLAFCNIRLIIRHLPSISLPYSSLRLLPLADIKSCRR